MWRRYDRSRSLTVTLRVTSPGSIVGGDVAVRAAVGIVVVVGKGVAALWVHAVVAMNNARARIVHRATLKFFIFPLDETRKQTSNTDGSSLLYDSPYFVSTRNFPCKLISADSRPQP